jgi:Holliday junction resolvase RusA-like endonuclease
MTLWQTEANPWLWVWIPGKAIPQGSLKGFIAGGKVVMRHSDDRLIAWRGYAAGLISQVASDSLGEAAVKVTATFHVERPKSHFTSKGELRANAPKVPTSRPDLDKYLRAILDSLTISGLIKDDSQVVAIGAAKVYGTDAGVALSVDPL